jgi:hypothetical protein
VEIDLSPIASPHGKKTILFGLIPALVLVILGLIGQPYTRTGSEGYSQVLSWDGWRWFLMEQQYQAQLKQLQQEANLLIEMLNASPDPVNAQLFRERVERQYRSGSPLLAYARKLLLTAAANVQDWTVGAVTYEHAAASIDQLVKALTRAEKSDDEPTGNLTPTPTPQSGISLPVLAFSRKPHRSLLEMG